MTTRQAERAVRPTSGTAALLAALARTIGEHEPAFVESLDRNVERLYRQLEDLHQTDETTAAMETLATAHCYLTLITPDDERADWKHL